MGYSATHNVVLKLHRTAIFRYTMHIIEGISNELIVFQTSGNQMNGLAHILYYMVLLCLILT